MVDEVEITDETNNDDRVLAMAAKVKRDYFAISELTRFVNEDTEAIRCKALENRKLLAAYLEPDAFVKLSDEAKGAVLQYSIMGALLFESNLEAQPDSYWEECLKILEQGEEILESPFYHKVFPDYAWDTFRFRICYYGSMLAYSLLPQKIAVRVCDYAEKLKIFLANCKNEAILAAIDGEQADNLAYLASVQAGYIPAREACEKFYRDFMNRDSGDYSVTGVDKNLDPPSSYMSVAKMMKLKLMEEDYDRFFTIQKAMLEYLYHIPNRSDVYLKCMTLFANLPMYFQEVPGAMTLEEFCINAFASVHPPTYVHVNMVARLAECMARHLVELMPEVFAGFPGCGDPLAVQEQKSRIIDYTFHAALCHDLGKLFILDTISMYGRKLLDLEFETIKHHPMIGACLAAEHNSTRKYVDVILGHHIWYDCSRGYPADFDTRKSPYKAIIDVVLVADCLDAATDTVGRSYSKGKTFEEFKTEVLEGLGTHYAPFFGELFEKEEFCADIEYLLSEGRERLYRHTYDLIMRQKR